MGFKRKRQFTEEVIGDEPLDLPTRSFPTVALWFDIPDEALDEIDKMKLDLAGGLHAAEHAAIGMLPFFAMCDRADIGGVSIEQHPDTGKPHTAHTVNPVPFVIAGSDVRGMRMKSGGRLCDIATTLLPLLDLEPHPNMEGINLL